MGTIVDTSKMSQKLNNVDDLLNLFNDSERLKSYRYSQPVVSECGIDNEKFHLDLPYEEIRDIVGNEKCRLIAALPENEKDDLHWEHVGSTSIKGMPGTMMPDALILLKQFPPSRGLVQALLDCGYYFSSSSQLDAKDLWWFLVYTEGLLKDHKLTVHITTPDTPAAKILLDTRDMCRSEQWAFDDYKNAKIAAYQDSSFSQYKQGKGKNSKLLQMLRDKHSS